VWVLPAPKANEKVAKTLDALATEYKTSFEVWEGSEATLQGKVRAPAGKPGSGKVSKASAWVYRRHARAQKKNQGDALAKVNKGLNLRV